MFSVILRRNAKALSLKTILDVGWDYSRPDGSGRWWGRTTFKSGGLRAVNGESEPLHSAITVKLCMV